MGREEPSLPEEYAVGECVSFYWMWSRAEDLPAADTGFRMGPLSLPLREVSWHFFFPDVPPHHNLAVPVPHVICHFQCLQAV